MNQPPKLKAFKNLLANYCFYKQELNKIEEEIEEIYYLLGGVHGIDMAKVVTHTPPNKEREYYLRERIEVLKKNKARYQTIVDSMDEILSKIKTSEKTAIIAVYIEGKTAVKVACDMNLSPTALFHRMNRELKKALIE